MELELSVVVPTRNRRDSLLRTLASLHEQTLAATRFEIVVVDDGGSDGTPAAIEALLAGAEWRDFSVHCIRQEWQGAAAARNTGLRAARGTWVLFLDDDTQAHPDLLAAHLRHQHAGPAAGHVVLGLIEQEVGIGALSAELGNWWKAHYRRMASGPVPWHALFTGNVSVPRAAAVAVGGFSDAFRYGEDVEFGYRLHAAGLPFTFAADAVVHTRSPKSPSELVRDLRRVGRAELAIYRLAPEVLPELGIARFGVDALLYRLIRRLVLRLDRLPGGSRIVDHAFDAWARSDLRLARRQIFRCLRMLAFWRGVREDVTPDEWRRITVRGVPVLMYHSIASVPRKDPYTVDPRKFARQMALLRFMRRRVLPLEELVDEWHAGQPSPRRAVALTFDDGYRNNATEAWPVLTRHGYPATLFFVTGLAGRGNAWDVEKGRHRLPLLTWDEVRELDAGGFRAQSHSVTHLDLRLADPEQRSAEMRDSRRHLESQVGHSSGTLFAYPYGGRNAAVIAEARAAGYRAAFSVRPGLNGVHTAQWDRPRVAIYGTDGLLRFAAKVWLGSDPRHRFPRWLGGTRNRGR